MIEYIAEVLLKYLLNKQVISQDKEVMDYYRYGLEIAISSLLNLFVIILLGGVSHHWIESIVFLPVFITIRQLTGGYHADTYFKCNLYLGISYIFVLVIYEMCTWSIIEICVVDGWAWLMILWFCPIENPNKPIPKGNVGKLKLKAVISVFLVGVVSIVLWCYQMERMGMFLSEILCLITSLVIIAKGKEKYDGRKEKK